MIVFQTVIGFTNLPGVTDITVFITVNGVTTWESYARDRRRSSISYTLKLLIIYKSKQVGGDLV